MNDNRSIGGYVMQLDYGREEITDLITKMELGNIGPQWTMY